MRRALGAGIAFAAAAIGLARNARASSAFPLDYSAPAECPSEEGLLADVRERIADRKIEDADGRHFRVRIVAERGTYRGALETFDPPSVREVGGESCEEVARALVVFLALAMSPPDSDVASSASPPESDAPSNVIPPVPREKDVPRAPLSAPRADVSDGRWRLRPRFGLDVRALVATGVAPGLAPGGAVAARLVLATRPSFRWIAHGGGLVTYREEPAFDGAFTFLWSAARVDAGPSVDVGRFRVSGGPAVRAGVLAVRARDLPSAASYSAFWGDVGAFARLDRPLTPAVELSLMVELAAPLQRKSFGIQGVEAPVHEIPPVVGTVSFGVTLGQ